MSLSFRARSLTDAVSPSAVKSFCVFVYIHVAQNGVVVNVQKVGIADDDILLYNY